MCVARRMAEREFRRSTGRESLFQLLVQLFVKYALFTLCTYLYLPAALGDLLIGVPRQQLDDRPALPREQRRSPRCDDEQRVSRESGVWGKTMQNPSNLAPLGRLYALIAKRGEKTLCRVCSILNCSNKYY